MGQYRIDDLDQPRIRLLVAVSLVHTQQPVLGVLAGREHEFAEVLVQGFARLRVHRLAQLTRSGQRRLSPERAAQILERG